MIHDAATCAKCGANAWTSCKHREALRDPPAVDDYKDRRERARLGTGGGRFSIKPAVMQGLNFKTRKRK